MLLNQRRLYENYYETNNWPSYVGLFPLFFFHWTIKSKKHCETLGNTTLLSSYRRKKKNQTFKTVSLHYYKGQLVSKERFF